MTRIIEIVQRSGGVASAQAAAATAQTAATAATAAAAQADAAADALEAALPAPALDNEAGLLLQVRVSGVTTTRQVTVGAADSGGTGFRILRVPN